MCTLFTYCIPYDDGAAPNPYWGTCTLVICKPKIRRRASEGDWVVGTGAMDTRIGNASGKVVYAMRVSKKMTMSEYDSWTQRFLPEKIPDWQSSDIKRRLGDSIYDFSSGIPKQRKGVHLHGNQETDIRGQFALLSDHFFYFGDHPIPLPPELLPIVKQGQGHRSASNGPFRDQFIKWIHSLGYEINGLAGSPQLDLFSDTKLTESCANGRCTEGKLDEEQNDDENGDCG